MSDPEEDGDVEEMSGLEVTLIGCTRVLATAILLSAGEKIGVGCVETAVKVLELIEDLAFIGYGRQPEPPPAAEEKGH